MAWLRKKKLFICHGAFVLCTSSFQAHALSMAAALEQSSYHQPISIVTVGEDPMVQAGGAVAISVAKSLSGGDDSIIDPTDDAQSVTWLQTSSSLCHEHVQGQPSTLHVVLQSKRDAQNLLESDIMNDVSCLGIQIAVNSGSQLVAPETAQNVGMLMQEILSCHESIPVALTLDVNLHLAMLQANSLPKTARHNCFQVLCPGETISVEYNYDWNNPFGGTDPLACGSSESRFFGSTSNKAIQAAAYTTLLGFGFDVVSSAGIATSIAAVMQSNFEYNIDTVRSIIDFYQTNLEVTEETGTLRQKYIEFGYK